MQRLRSDINKAKSEAAQWQRSFEEQQQAASLSDKRRQETEQELTEQVRQLQAKLQDEQEQGRGEAAESGAGIQPEINVPIFPLNSVRGGGQDSNEPVNAVTLPRSQGSFLISLGLQDEAKYKDYRVTIFDDRNRPLFRRNGLKPGGYNFLSIRFNSEFFRPGNYTLALDGISEEGSTAAIGHYPFRVIKDR
jgi:DNA primase